MNLASFTHREAACYIAFFTIVWTLVLWLGSGKPIGERIFVGLVGIVILLGLRQAAYYYGDVE